jgi:hypothetical protein
MRKHPTAMLEFAFRENSRKRRREKLHLLRTIDSGPVALETEDASTSSFSMTMRGAGHGDLHPASIEGRCDSAGHKRGRRTVSPKAYEKLDQGPRVARAAATASTGCA